MLTADIGAAVAMLSSMARLWAEATPDERADILRTVLDHVVIDITAGRIDSFTPKTEYAALFRAAYDSQELESISGSDGIGIRFRLMGNRR